MDLEEIKTAVETTRKALPKLVEATEALISISKPVENQDLSDEAASLAYGQQVWEGQIKARKVIHDLENLT